MHSFDLFYAKSKDILLLYDMQRKETAVRSQGISVTSRRLLANFRDTCTAQVRQHGLNLNSQQLGSPEAQAWVPLAAARK